MIVRVIVRNWKGTVRCTALMVRLRGVADAEELFAVFEGDFDRPAVGVALDDLRRGGVKIGGDQRELIAAGLGGVLDEDYADRRLWDEWLPKAVDHVEHQRFGLAVAADARGGPFGGGAGRDLREAREPPTPFAGSAALAGARRGGLVDRGVRSQPGGDRDPLLKGPRHASVA
jgi:hypothetical protein